MTTELSDEALNGAPEQDRYGMRVWLDEDGSPFAGADHTHVMLRYEPRSSTWRDRLADLVEDIGIWLCGVACRLARWVRS